MVMVTFSGVVISISPLVNFIVPLSTNSNKLPGPNINCVPLARRRVAALAPRWPTLIQSPTSKRIFSAATLQRSANTGLIETLPSRSTTLAIEVSADKGMFCLLSIFCPVVDICNLVTKAEVVRAKSNRV